MTIMNAINQINYLSDDCVRLILLKIPLQQLISIHRSICARWLTIIEHQICAQMQSLKLFDSEHDHSRLTRILADHNLQDRIDFRLLNDNLILNQEKFADYRAIPALFPKISRLLIGNFSSLYTDHLVPMLAKWQHSLISLTMFGLPSPDQLPIDFWSTLNKLPNLRRLNLVHLYKCTSIPHEEIAQVLGQLEHLSIVHYRNDSVPILSQLTSNCKYLRLSWIYFGVDQLASLLELNPRILQLERLTLENISCANPSSNREDNFRELFALFCDRFIKLHFLDILFADHLPLQDLMPHLNRLNNLQELWFYLGASQLPQTLNGNYCALISQPQRSIKVLYLEVFNITTEQFYLFIPKLFPNLEKLTIKCNDCFSGQRSSSDCSKTNSNNLRTQFTTRLKGEFHLLHTFKLK